MSDALATSPKVAFSYSWNNGIDNHISCAANITHSIIAFVKAVFGKYPVSEAMVDGTKLLSDHKDSIFSKAYLKRKAIASQSMNAYPIATLSHLLNETENEACQNETTSNTPDIKAIMENKDNTIEEALNGITSRKISAETFKELENNNAFDDSIHYIITESFSLSHNNNIDEIYYIVLKKITLPKHLTVEGDFDLSYQNNLNHLPERLIVKGSLILRECIGIKDISKTHIQADKNINFSFCTNMQYPPSKVVAGNGIIFIYCSSMLTIPEHLDPGYTLLFSGCSKKIKSQFKKRSYPRIL